mmetsp:Transcript_51440/g.65863  ORF Transcript_51440/g.65863 Transcript_51440/m.65863 type:complete len:233 (+) Transcript_51440:679-1377(+)
MGRYVKKEILILVYDIHQETYFYVNIFILWFFAQITFFFFFLLSSFFLFLLFVPPTKNTKAHYDDESESYYYKHNETKEIVWEKPESYYFDEELEQQEVNHDGHVHNKENGDGDEYDEVFDDETQKYYYIHRISGETVWEKPITTPTRSLVIEPIVYNEADSMLLPKSPLYDLPPESPLTHFQNHNLGGNEKTDVVYLSQSSPTIKLPPLEQKHLSQEIGPLDVSVSSSFSR